MHIRQHEKVPKESRCSMLLITVVGIIVHYYNYNSVVIITFYIGQGHDEFCTGFKYKAS